MPSSANPPPDDAPHGRRHIDPDELQRLVAAGLTQPRIAQALGVSETTVQRRIRELRRDRPQLAPELDLRARVLRVLEHAAVEDGNVPAARALLDALVQQEAETTWADAQAQAARVYLRELARRLGEWCREQIAAGDAEIARLYPRCAGVAPHDDDRIALARVVEARGWAP